MTTTCAESEAVRADPDSAHSQTTSQRMRQRAAIDVFEFPADRHAMGDTAGANTITTYKLRKQVRGCLTLYCGIGRKNHLLHTASSQ